LRQTISREKYVFSERGEEKKEEYARAGWLAPVLVKGEKNPRLS